MTLETLKELIEIEFYRADNIYKLKSDVFKLLDIYESENKKLKHGKDCSRFCCRLFKRENKQEETNN